MQKSVLEREADDPEAELRRIVEREGVRGVARKYDIAEGTARRWCNRHGVRWSPKELHYRLMEMDPDEAP
jgi:hypothetical protein